MFNIVTLNFFTFLPLLYNNFVKHKNQINICSWSELFLKTENDNYYYEFPHKMTNIGFFENDDYIVKNADNFYLKLACPWIVKANESCNIIWNNCSKHNIENINIEQAINKNELVQVYTNIVLQKTQNHKDYFINFNEPLMQGTVDKKFKIKTHLISQSKFYEMNNCAIRIENIKKGL